MNRSLVVGLVASATYACGESRPSESQGRAAVEAELAQTAAKPTIVTFTKTDGQASEALGAKFYLMQFTAIVENSQHIGPLYVYNEPVRYHCKGDRGEINGSITFEEYESGWRVSQVFGKDEFTPIVTLVGSPRRQRCAPTAAAAPSIRSSELSDDATIGRTTALPPGAAIDRTLTAESFVGEYYDGGPYCLKIAPAGQTGIVTVLIWYCAYPPETSGINATLTRNELHGRDGKTVIRAFGSDSGRTTVRCSGGGMTCVTVVTGPVDYPDSNTTFERMRDGVGKHR